MKEVLTRVTCDVCQHSVTGNWDFDEEQVGWGVLQVRCSDDSIQERQLCVHCIGQIHDRLDLLLPEGWDQPTGDKPVTVDDGVSE